MAGDGLELAREVQRRLDLGQTVERVARDLGLPTQWALRARLRDVGCDLRRETAVVVRATGARVRELAEPEPVA